MVFAEAGISAKWVLKEGMELLSSISKECAVLYTRRKFVVQSETGNLIQCLTRR